MLTEGRPIPRNGSPTPCETVGDNGSKCPKGHWSEEVKLTSAEEAFISTYRGGTLTEREKREPIVRKVCGVLAEIESRAESENLSEAIALAIIGSLRK